MTTAHADEQVRCWRCNRLLAVLLTRPWRIVCPKCKSTNTSKDPLDNRTRSGEHTDHVA